jgi:hypothetical protein
LQDQLAPRRPLKLDGNAVAAHTLARDPALFAGELSD